MGVVIGSRPIRLFYSLLPLVPFCIRIRLAVVLDIDARGQQAGAWRVVGRRGSMDAWFCARLVLFHFRSLFFFFFFSVLHTGSCAGW
ncbi:hypothetical protein B0I35DRAFT_120140 [Stachybotrys elegans]|uniref:Uncharacterized protein n=1 Tax=Stachybotrys elegans TaxID=80388 RepID=A0A8K0T3K0_9HYPO|nr:hypothetical protein B0I35DRAFT_120140 [Stachybotrys elegans]